MCFKNPFKKEYTIPHPEEKPDYSVTMDNYDLNQAYSKWFASYNVPLEYQDYWRNKGVIVIVTLNTLLLPNGTNAPAQVEYSTDKTILKVRPEYLNAGVLAHENAHVSWFNLTDSQREEFKILYKKLLIEDTLMVYLDSINSYMNTNETEGFAEVYRYLGQDMPDILKKFYLKLF